MATFIKPANKTPPASIDPTPSSSRNLFFKRPIMSNKTFPKSLKSMPSLKSLCVRCTTSVRDLTKPRRKFEPLPSIIVICSDSHALASNVKSPAKLSSRRFAICSAAPSALRIAFSNFSKSASLAFIIASQPGKAGNPAIS